MSYTLRGVHTKLNVIWDWEAPAGVGDTHFAFYRGTRARVEVRQTQGRQVPARSCTSCPRSAALQAAGAGGGAGEDRGAADAVSRASASRIAAPRSTSRFPTALRVGHEAHFAQVTANFLEYLRQRQALPAWERPNMLAKYYVTTTGTELEPEGPAAAGAAHRAAVDGGVPARPASCMIASACIPTKSNKP